MLGLVTFSNHVRRGPKFLSTKQNLYFEIDETKSVVCESERDIKAWKPITQIGNPKCCS